MSTELVLPGSVTETSLELPVGLDWAQWEQTGEMLGRINRANAWWIGDWVNYGEHSYGEKYAQAIDVTGLEYGTVAQYAWVASKVTSRLDNLSFSHHQEVAGLEPEDQATWLQRALEAGWSKAQLRAAIKEAKQSTNGHTAIEPEVEQGSSENQPHAKHVLGGVWNSLNQIELASGGLSNVDAELVVKNATSEELVQMLELTESSLTSLRTFQARLEEWMQRS